MSINPRDLFLDGKYEVAGQALGKGAFGAVQLCRVVGTDEQVAIKLIDGSRTDKYVSYEVGNHWNLKHPHIIDFKEAFRTQHSICMVLEYANHGTLTQYIAKAKGLHEAAARWFFQQLIVAVDFCHMNGVSNRDIKPENILLHQVPGYPLPFLKLADFGFSKSTECSVAHTKAGTITYMAPEVIQHSGPERGYDGNKADIWSCGVVLYTMLFFLHPFAMRGQTKGDVQSRILAMDWEIPEGAPISPECRAFLQGVIVKDPKDRMSMAQILAHPWFVKDLPKGVLEMNAGLLAKAS